MIAKYRLLLEIAAGLLVIATFFWFRHHEQQIGVERERSAVNRAVLDAQEAARVEYEKKATVASSIGDRYEAEIAKPVAAPVVRIVRVRDPAICPGQVSSPATTARKPDAEAREREEAAPDIGVGVVTVGRDADAQIRALQAYVAEVCVK